MNRLDQMDQMGDLLGGGKRPRLEEGDAVWWSQTTERRLISVWQTTSLKYKFAKLQIQIYKFIQIQTYTFWWSQTTERRLISVCQTIGLKYKSIHILVKIMFDVDFDDFDIGVLLEVYADVNDSFEAEVDV